MQNGRKQICRSLQIDMQITYSNVQNQNRAIYVCADLFGPIVAGFDGLNF